MTETQEAPPQAAAYKSFGHFMAALLFTAAGFAVALSFVLTILLFGMGIMINGLKMALLEIQLGEYPLLLRSPASCAIVEIIILALSVPAIGYTAPRLLRQYAYYRQWLAQRFHNK